MEPFAFLGGAEGCALLFCLDLVLAQDNLGHCWHRLTIVIARPCTLRAHSRTAEEEEEAKEEEEEVEEEIEQGAPPDARGVCGRPGLCPFASTFCRPPAALHLGRGLPVFLIRRIAGDTIRNPLGATFANAICAPWQYFKRSGLEPPSKESILFACSPTNGLPREGSLMLNPKRWQ